ncbi:DNA-3-methyladenine glycosylase I [Microbacterium sp. STN6]|uniref:DNA-3-methyladenine glycosylase I n=1 Tax=Microbacterium sp. STN6 TaxID=2995588 RepID=UPI002260863D|nr:DNA-3-methyladenine glycosylase I [Microbacterium sp. STN6]MCX7521180.1 DNA-3-methyladenine glycosylase I [Microbacterium sp. STN6]
MTRAQTRTADAPRAALVAGDDGRQRCSWAAADAEYRRYHDEEWGTPQHDDVALFESLCLEGFQAGLSWITILKRRGHFREVFHGFDVHKVAEMAADDVERLLADERIIRNRSKIEATIGNARAALELDRPLGDLLWSFAPTPVRPRPESLGDLVTRTPESVAMSVELRRRGFRFVGPTTMHALMQSCGMLDDHVTGCWRSL